MSNLWWLLPDWKAAVCPSCGVNIWDSGGDPDWGENYVMGDVCCYSLEKQEKDNGQE